MMLIIYCFEDVFLLSYFIVSEDDLDGFCRKLKMSHDKYLSETKKALSRQNVGALTFKYEIKEKSDEEVVLVWKKFIPADKIKVSHTENIYLGQYIKQLS